MSHHYKAVIDWKLSGPDFVKGRYSREHTWTFDGGVTVAATVHSPSAPRSSIAPTNCPKQCGARSAP